MSQEDEADRLEPSPARFVLVTGKLSMAGLGELAKRVRAGENETAVRAELLVREQKAVAG